MTALMLRIRELREAKGWTQGELGERAGVRRATVNRIELGRTTAVDFAVLEALARALQVAPGYLIARRPERPAAQGR